MCLKCLIGEVYHARESLAILQLALAGRLFPRNSYELSCCHMAAYQISRRFRHAVHCKLPEYCWLVHRVNRGTHPWPNGEAFWNPAYIQLLGLQPASVIDVRGAPGTPELYEAFPNLYLVLVDPTLSIRPPLRSGWLISCFDAPTVSLPA